MTWEGMQVSFSTEISFKWKCSQRQLVDENVQFNPSCIQEMCAKVENKTGEVGSGDDEQWLGNIVVQ